MSRFDRPVLRIAAAAALLLGVALTLSACGRRGPLDPPPGSAVGPGGALMELDRDGKPLAPPGEKKRLPIDWLLD